MAEMEGGENLSKIISKNLTGEKSYFEKIFNFDTESRGEMSNVLQYTFISIIPIILLNKLIQYFSPEVDEEKKSLEILFEIIIQLVVLFIGLFFINRVVTIIPTYSKINYPTFSLSGFLILVLVMFSFQTKLGEKMNILIERLEHLWGGGNKEEKYEKKHHKSNVRVSQPISGQSQQQQQYSQPSYTGTTSINNLPTGPSQNSTSPNYDGFYKDQNNPLINAATPGGMDGSSWEPEPANGSIGGSGFSNF